jgi:hypothetical protein
MGISQDGNFLCTISQQQTRKPFILIPQRAVARCHLERGSQERYLGDCENKE